MSLLTGARSSSLGNSFWTSLTAFGVFCYFHFVIKNECYVPTELPMSIRPVNSQCSRQKELASGSNAQMVPWNGGPKCLSAGLFAFSSPYFHARPKACSQAIEKEVFRQLYSYLTENSTLSKFQSEFRPNYSTLTSLIQMCGDGWKILIW